MADGFASLTSGLLARKGQARPAMRPQGFATPTALDDLGWNDMGHDGPRPIAVRLPTHLSGAPAAQPAPVPAVLRQQEDLAAALEAAPVAIGTEPVFTLVEPLEVEPVPPPSILPEDAGAPVEAAPPPVDVAPPEAVPVAPQPTPVARRAAPKTMTAPVAPQANGRKAAFTLRLDIDRHLRLRLACAVENRSAQQLVIQALDRLLADMPDVDRLAQSLPAGKA